MGQTLRVAAAQMLTVSGDFAGNLSRCEEMLREASRQQVEIVCFPEFFLTGIEDQEGKAGAALKFLVEKAKTYGLDIVAGTIPETEDGRHYNTCYYVDSNGKIVDKYRKTHLYLMEKQFRTPGNRLVVIEHPKAKIGLALCWEAFFPEVSRRLAQLGAEVIICPTWVEDWEGEQGGVAERRAIALTRSVENQVFFVDVGSCGQTSAFGHQMRLAGHSRVIGPGPLGRVIQEAGYEPGLIVADLDLAEIDRKREFFKLWETRREDLYS